MFLIIVLINLESNWLKVQQRGVPGTREILEGLIEKVDIPDQKIILADLTMNKLLGAIKRHLLLFIQLEVRKKDDGFSVELQLQWRIWPFFFGFNSSNKRWIIATLLFDHSMSAQICDQNFQSWLFDIIRYRLFDHSMSARPKPSSAPWISTKKVSVETPSSNFGMDDDRLFTVDSAGIEIFPADM